MYHNNHDNYWLHNSKCPEYHSQIIHISVWQRGKIGLRWCVCSPVCAQMVCI